MPFMGKPSGASVLLLVVMAAALLHNYGEMAATRAELVATRAHLLELSSRLDWVHAQQYPLKIRGFLGAN